MFSKLNMPKSLAVLLDILVVLAIGIFAAVCITVWIAKRYGKKQLQNRQEAKIQSLKTLLSWLKVLISKEVEDVNYVLYTLKQNNKNPFTKKVNSSYFKAIERILQELEGIQNVFLNVETDVYCLSKNTSLYNNLFESYFYKFTVGYYQKVLESLEFVLQDTSVQKLFNLEELDEIGRVVQYLQLLVQQQNMQDFRVQRQYIETKIAFWRELLNTVIQLDLESSLQEGIEIEGYWM